MQLRQPLALFVFFLLGLIALPAAHALQPGKDYLPLQPAQATDSPGKFEVIEFFAYTCSHCFDLEPELVAWLKTLPRDVTFKRVPAVFSEKWEPMARAYYTLEALGQLDALHGEVFEAIHVKNRNLGSAASFADWAASHGLNRKRVLDTYNSFAVGMKMAQAKQMSQAYRLSGVPALVVNGRYLTSGSLTGSHSRTLQVVDSLIARERGGRR